MLIDDVVARLGTTVPVLAERVQGGLDLAELIRRKALPNYTPAAFVVDNGISFGRAEFSESMFLQAADEGVSIVLVLRTAADVAGSVTQPKLSALKWDVIFALAGWSPAATDDGTANGVDPVGVLEPRRGRVVALDAGTVFYQLDFAIQQQVRIVS